MSSPSVSRDLFLKDKNYLFNVVQQGKGRVDADCNDGMESLFWLVRDLGYALGVTGFVGSGWDIAEYSADTANNFEITSGYGYSAGYRFYNGTTSRRNLAVSAGWANRGYNSVFTAVGTQTAADLRMNWGTNDHVTKTVIVLRTSDMTLLSYTVSANSSSVVTFQIGDDLTSDGIQVGDPYCIVLSTPGADRTDLVCLNCFLDYVDSEEDEELLHAIGSGLEFDQRRKMRAVVEIVEGVSTPSDPLADLPSDYVDGLGNSHFYVGLASISRLSGVSAVTSSDITDLRTDLAEIGEFVKKTGDTMSGDLDMDGNAVTGGSVEDMDTVESEVFSFLDSTGTELVEMYADGDATLNRIVLRHPSANTRPPVAAGTPLIPTDLTTKEYVDDLITGHNHPAYIEKEALYDGMVRWTETEIDAACTAQLIHNFIAPGEYVDWVHGLGSDFLLTQVKISPSSGVYIDMWVEGIGTLDLVVVDANTIRLANPSASNVYGARIRCFAMVTVFTHVMSLVDVWNSSDFVDSDEGLVT